MNDRREDGSSGFHDQERATRSGRAVRRRVRFLILVGTAVVCLTLMALLVI
jgi:hypothetical protein